MSESKKISVFLIITFALSYILEFYVILNGGVNTFGIFMLTGLMWIPAISSFVVRIVSKDWKDIGRKVGNLKYHAIAFFAPMLLSFIVFLFCSLLDIKELELVRGVPLGKIVGQYLIIFTIGLFSALGEEIGWRGFLTPKIYKANWRYPTLVSGIIWTVWHLPLVAFGGYYKEISPLTIIVLYSTMILVLNIFINWIRLSSGSLLVATFAHAFYNFFFQTFWLHLLFKKPGQYSSYWLTLGGDMGLLTSIAFAILIYFGVSKLKFKIALTKDDYGS